MIKYNFDKIVDRSGTGALKLDVLNKRYGRSDLLPLWVADMDFETPEFIVDAISKRLEHHIFGYTVEPEDYWPTVIDWIESHHQWNINEDWITYIPGIVKGIGMAVNVFTQKDEKVIIQPPVYHPFRLTPIGNGREVVFNPLKRNEDGTYEMDFDNLTEVADNKCRMLILSNPHNPGGIVWSKETLVRLADFCYDHNILVLSDEIHCDMALYGNKHIPFASVSDKAAHCSITFGAPTKTFNLAGIVSSYAIIHDDKIRAQYFGWLRANELNEPTLFAPIATIAAFRYGEEWRKQMLEYVEGNIDYVIEYCAKNIPQIKPLRPQASFLLWLDCRDLNLNHEQLNDLFINKANLALNDGEMFGIGGEGYMRLNVGCPRALLNKAMARLKNAIAK
jgi:cysteine-S-conjugate beta-lyase